MGRKFVAALMAAVALLPGIGMAQERGDGRGWNSGAAQRQGNDGGWQRGGRQARGPERQQQGGGERTWQRPTTVQDRGPMRQSPDGERTWRRSTDQGRGDQVRGDWAQRRDNPRPEAARDPQQERRVERRDGGAGQWAGRSSAGAVTQEPFRGDRNRDAEAFRRDRTRDRGDLSRERRDDGQRRWARSGADWNDQDRWASRRQGWGDQGRWYDRNGRTNWNRDWRRDSRYDWTRWRATNRNAFHLPRYYAPYGWNQGYRRFSVGFVLSSALFAQNYWISDPWAYRLPNAGGDVRWVRYYNDALLVDVYSGEVVDVIHDMFW